MKDEIKDLKCLGALGNLQSFAIDGTKGSKIVDINVNIVKRYITNLQEENERLKENAIHNDKVVDKAKWNEMIYKSRNDKAIEYINTHYLNANEPELLYILQGENDDRRNME